MTAKVGIGDAIYLKDKKAIEISKYSDNDWGWYSTLDDFGSQKPEDPHPYIAIEIIEHKKIWGILGSKWEAKIIEHNIKEYDTNVTGVEIKIEKVKKKKGLPHEVSAIIVVINKDGRRKEYSNQVFTRRISIKYYKALMEDDKEAKNDRDSAFLIEDSGYYPSYFIFMLGKPGQGKSFWLGALTKVEENLKKHHIYHFRPEVTTAQDSTSLEEVLIHDFYLKKERGKSLAAVYLVDLSGEITTAKYQDTNAVKMFHSKIDDFAAGVFVVRNSDWLFDREERQPAGENDEEIDKKNQRNNLFPQNLEKILNALEDNDDERNKTIKQCYILTEADKIKEALEGKELDEKLREVFYEKIGLTFEDVEDEQYRKLKEALLNIDLNVAGRRDTIQYQEFKRNLLETKLEQHETLEEILKNEKIVNPNEDQYEDLKTKFLEIDLTLNDEEDEKQYENFKESLGGIKFEQYKTLKDILKEEGIEFTKEQYDTVKESVRTIKEKDGRLKNVLKGINLTPDSPIFNRQRGRIDYDRQMEMLYKNLAVTSDVMNYSKNIEYPSFCVSACCNRKENGFTKKLKNGRADVDLDQYYNVEFPLIYMLQMLVKIK